MKLTCHRRYLTLLEMMIVISILAVVGGIVAIGINKALVDQRFRNEVSLIVDELRMAQDLMLILGVDVYVNIAPDPSNQFINMGMVIETKLPDSIEKEIIKREHHLKVIRGVFFEDETATTESTDLNIRFLSKGTVMSKAILLLTTSDKHDAVDNVLRSYICLPGYPKPIFSTDDFEVAKENCANGRDDGLGERLTQDTWAKLPDKLKEPPEEQQKESDKPKKA